MGKTHFDMSLSKGVERALGGFLLKFTFDMGKGKGKGWRCPYVYYQN